MDQTNFINFASRIDQNCRKFNYIDNQVEINFNLNGF